MISTEWAAGFFEGEGCITMASRKDTAVIRLQNQKFRRPLVATLLKSRPHA